MNDSSGPTELAQNQFATTVRNFTPKLSAKFQKLLPFKDGIAELRRKGASYETITNILRDTNVVVSHDTVTRFCREVPGLTPRSSRRRRASVKTVQQDSSSNPKTHRIHKADSSCTTKSDTPSPPFARPRDAGGPRIADINTL
ncbi:MAG TPA: hypothetical protein VMV72_01095 [Verrucomicrobiae bacterium]|nr:hypothetical protein [Verrucomicrobiae bacterium]